MPKVHRGILNAFFIAIFTVAGFPAHAIEGIVVIVERCPGDGTDTFLCEDAYQMDLVPDLGFPDSDYEGGAVFGSGFFTNANPDSTSDALVAESAESPIVYVILNRIAQKFGVSLGSALFRKALGTALVHALKTGATNSSVVRLATNTGMIVEISFVLDDFGDVFNWSARLLGANGDVIQLFDAGTDLNDWHDVWVLFRGWTDEIWGLIGDSYGGGDSSGYQTPN